jgi:hypothetical protein
VLAVKNPRFFQIQAIADGTAGHWLNRRGRYQARSAGIASAPAPPATPKSPWSILNGGCRTSRYRDVGLL